MAASLGNATVNVLARTVLFEQSLRRSLKKMSALTAGVFAGVAAANFFGSAIKDSLALEKQVAKIQTFIADLSPQMQKAFSPDTIRAFSNELGISATETADALYYMIGSGVAAEDAFDAVRAAASSAIATTSDLGLVSNFTSSALNAFGGTVDTLTGKMMTADHINDLFFAALKEGKGTANDLAKYLSTAIPSARGLGIGLGEVVSAASAATLTGKSARKVMTGLDYVMSGLGNSSKGVGEVFKDITGKSFPDFVKKGGTLKDAIKKLGTEVGIQQLNNVKGATTGIRAIQELLVVWEDYERVQKNVRKTENDAAIARDTVNKTFARQIEILQNKFKNFRGSVGDWLGPILYEAFKKIEKVWPKIKGALSQLATIVGDAFSQIGAALGPAFEQIGLAFGKINWGQIQSILSDVFTGIMIGLTPLIAAIGTLVYIFGGMAAYIQPAIDVLSNLTPVIVGLTTAFVAYKAVLLLVTAAKGAMVAVAGLQAIASVAVAAAFVIETLATEGLAAAFVALDIASGGIVPAIGLIITAVVALAAGIIYAWKTSETFRDVVAKVFNALKDIVATAIQVIVHVILSWPEAILRSFEVVLKGLAHIPKWLGGGAFDSAAAAVGALIAGIDSIRGAVNNLAASARAADWEVNKLLNSAEMLSDEGNRGRARDFAATGKTPQQLMDEAAGYKAPTIPSYTPPSFAGGGYDVGGGAGDAAKEKASEAAKKIKAALKRVAADLTRIAKNTSKQTVDTLKENFKQLYADLAEAGRKDVVKFAQSQEKALIKAAGKHSKVLKKILKDYKADSLVDLAVARDKVADKLDIAKDKLKEITDASKDFTDSIKEQVREMGNVADESKGLGTTYTGIRNQLRNAIAQTKQFTGYIDKLRKMKLNDVSLRQLIDAGPEAGMAAAKALVQSGQAGVNQIDTLQGQLNKAGEKLATTANNQFFAAGIKTAEGIVKGLESQEAAIVKAMDSIADKLVASIKKKLGIKSPSVVFGEIGENISKGMAMGIDNKASLPQKSAEKMTSQVVFGAGAVQVNGVSDPFAAKRAGILSGEGIASVLDRRRTVAALDQ